MSDARDLLRDFWRHGVRVHLMLGRFRLEPAGVAVEPLRHALREYAAEVKTLLGQLPTPDRCEACGDLTIGPAGNTGRLHCTTCALIYAKRRGWTVYAPGEEIDHAA